MPQTRSIKRRKLLNNSTKSTQRDILSHHHILHKKKGIGVIKKNDNNSTSSSYSTPHSIINTTTSPSTTSPPPSNKNNNSNISDDEINNLSSNPPSSQSIGLSSHVNITINTENQSNICRYNFRPRLPTNYRSLHLTGRNILPNRLNKKSNNQNNTIKIKKESDIKSKKIHIPTRLYDKENSKLTNKANNIKLFNKNEPININYHVEKDKQKLKQKNKEKNKQKPKEKEKEKEKAKKIQEQTKENEKNKEKEKKQEKQKENENKKFEEETKIQEKTQKLSSSLEKTQRLSISSSTMKQNIDKDILQKKQLENEEEIKEEDNNENKIILNANNNNIVSQGVSNLQPNVENYNQHLSSCMTDNNLQIQELQGLSKLCDSSHLTQQESVKLPNLTKLTSVIKLSVLPPQSLEESLTKAIALIEKDIKYVSPPKIQSIQEQGISIDNNISTQYHDESLPPLQEQITSERNCENNLTSKKDIEIIEISSDSEYNHEENQSKFYEDNNFNFKQNESEYNLSSFASNTQIATKTQLPIHRNHNNEGDEGNGNDSSHNNKNNGNKSNDDDVDIREGEISEEHSDPEEPDDLYEVDTKGYLVFKFGLKINSRFKLLKQLGKGTFSRVFSAIDTYNNTQKAIKVIRNVYKYQVAAKTELEVLRKIRDKDPLQTKCCVLLEEDGYYRGHPIFVFPLYGRSLYGFMVDNEYRPFSNQHIKSFALQIITGVEYVHSLDIIITDLKPENIILVNDRSIKEQSYNNNSTINGPIDTKIKLIDFGSAVFGGNELHTHLIQTRHYRAPEVVLKQSWSFSADIWSVGCILVELVSGTMLFNTHDSIDHLAQMITCIGNPPHNMIYNVDDETWDEYFEANGSLKLYKAKRSPVQCKASYQYFNSEQKLLSNLVHQMLQWDPEDRITAKDALRHPYFTENTN